MTAPSERAAWDDVYRSSPAQALPWYVERIDPDVDAAIRGIGTGTRGGPVLDLGTGPGTVAIELASRGFDVTALDISEKAIEGAKRRAGKLANSIRWVVGDLFDFEPSATFQLVLDRGIYHVFAAADRAKYPARVASWIGPGGTLILKCFSDQEPGDWGPNRIAPNELQRNFGPHFQVDRIERSTFPGSIGHEAQALLAVFRRPSKQRPVSNRS